MPLTPTKKIWMDGTLVDWENATTHVLSHTLHYGMGAFEGIRAYKTPQGVAIFRLREHMERSMRVLLDTVTQKISPAARIAAFAGVLPSQWKVMRQMQGTMSLIEGYSNLVMNELGDTLLPGFGELEEAYRKRSSNKSVLDQLIWKLTGLDLKLQQYKKGEAFCRAVYAAHGMNALNLAWKGPDQMPRLNELADPERWYRRVAG